MNQISNNKKTIYDLVERCFVFAKNVSEYVKALPRSIANYEYAKQLIRSSGLVGANYIEANESFGRKDFIMHLRISKKEAKESLYWLRLTDPKDQHMSMRMRLENECIEFTKIFGSIIEKSK